MSKKSPNITPKVIIGLPCQDSVSSKTAGSIAANIIESGVVVDILIKETCDIVGSRNWLISEADKRGATHLLFVDSDMFFPKETLTKLLSYDKDIIGVTYNKRKFPLEPTHQPIVDTPEPKTGLLRCLSVGMGVMLIKLSILDKLKEPILSFGRGSEGQLVLGEDVWFCRNAQDAGFEVWADPSIKVGHVGQFTY